MRYPNGDEVAYVSAVWDARVVTGDPTADQDEVTDVRWFTDADLADADLGEFCRATLSAVGVIRSP